MTKQKESLIKMKSHLEYLVKDTLLSIDRAEDTVKGLNNRLHELELTLKILDELKKDYQ